VGQAEDLTLRTTAGTLPCLRHSPEVRACSRLEFRLFLPPAPFCFAPAASIPQSTCLPRTDPYVAVPTVRTWRDYLSISRHNLLPIYHIAFYSCAGASPSWFEAPALRLLFGVRTLVRLRSILSFCTRQRAGLASLAWHPEREHYVAVLVNWQPVCHRPFCTCCPFRAMPYACIAAVLPLLLLERTALGRACSNLSAPANSRGAQGHRRACMYHHFFSFS